MTENVDCVVVGAGAVGLAAARALALAGREVIVIDRHTQIGQETSSRNSEVIHAGIYYPTGSLKSRLCVTGKQLLYRYCEEKGIPHRRCGKVIVATGAAQHAALEAIERQAARNGVHDLERLGEADLRALEPNVRGTAGLWSPSTGILDSHAYLLALLADFEHAGGTLAVLSELSAGVVSGDGMELEIRSGDTTTRFVTRALVNAGGLHASRVARSLRGLPAASIPVTRYARGCYFTYNGVSPFRHLVYPLPEEGGLGVHATLDLAGRVRFGPDVEWIDEIDYSLDPRRGDVFYRAVRAYWPALPDGTLSPGHVGVRPKLSGPGEPAADFLLQGPDVHGIPGLVNLYGIESPGLTASLAIAQEVQRLLLGTP